MLTITLHRSGAKAYLVDVTKLVAEMPRLIRVLNIELQEARAKHFRFEKVLTAEIFSDVYRKISDDFKGCALWLLEAGYITEEVCDLLGGLESGRDIDGRGGKWRRSRQDFLKMEMLQNRIRVQKNHTVPTYSETAVIKELDSFACGVRLRYH
ncbi:hypothetical protein B0H17DRAFT_1147105 [Mycena rosella]|uniref:Uncharacterized protein n=1 Tax=Mycena rosella TaxID=1033263 RepID=A0AAD7CML2_MYCRO|nr:hypothetical protein B0H17DRAFT_1147105 [Mycena rosella]